MGNYFRKVLIKNRLQVLDTDNDGVKDSIVFLPKEPINIQLMMTENIDDMGLYTEYEEEVEEVDFNGIWNTGNDGSGDGGDGYTESGGVSSGYGGGTITESGTGSSSVYGCTDNTAINYNPNATIDDGSCQGGFGGTAGTTTGNFGSTGGGLDPSALNASNTLCLQQYPSLVVKATNSIYTVNSCIETGNGLCATSSLFNNWKQTHVIYATIDVGGNCYVILRDDTSTTTVIADDSFLLNFFANARGNGNLAVWWLYPDSWKKTHLSYAAWVTATNSSGGPQNLIGINNIVGQKIRFAANNNCNAQKPSTSVLGGCPDVGDPNDGTPFASYPANCKHCASVSSTSGDKGDIIPTCFLEGLTTDINSTTNPKIKSTELNACPSGYYWNSKRTLCIRSSPPSIQPSTFNNTTGCFRPGASPPVYGWTKCGCDNGAVASSTNGKYIYNSISNFFGGIRFSANYYWGGLNANDDLIDHNTGDEAWAYRLAFMCSP